MSPVARQKAQSEITELSGSAAGSSDRFEGRTSRQELHDEVEVHLILEAVEHFNHPQAVCLHQDIPLSTDMTHLSDRVTQQHTHMVRDAQQHHSIIT